VILLICELSSAGLCIKSHKGCEAGISLKSLKDADVFAPELL